MPEYDPSFELLSVTRAARFLRVRPQEVVDAADSGRIPFVQMGSRKLFDPTELLEHLSHPHPEPEDGSDD